MQKAIDEEVKLTLNDENKKTKNTKQGTYKLELLCLSTWVEVYTAQGIDMIPFQVMR